MTHSQTKEIVLTGVPLDHPERLKCIEKVEAELKEGIGIYFAMPPWFRLRYYDSGFYECMIGEPLDILRRAKERESESP